MSDQPDLELAPVFSAVASTMEENRLAFNQADTFNGNHGDHMVEIFSIAAQAAAEKGAQGMAEAMDYAHLLLRDRPGNGSAQIYASGLSQLAVQFRKYDITLDELIHYIRKVVWEIKDNGGDTAADHSGVILKALVTALAGWQGSADGMTAEASPVSLSSMFDLGIAYMQARQRGGSREEVIADAAATISPLSRVPHRYQSGKLALLALLRALGEGSTSASLHTS